MRTLSRDFMLEISSNIDYQTKFRHDSPGSGYFLSSMSRREIPELY